jgi:hypothetical protein
MSGDNENCWPRETSGNSENCWLVMGDDQATTKAVGHGRRTATVKTVGLRERERERERELGSKELGSRLGKGSLASLHRTRSSEAGLSQHGHAN